MSDQQIRILCDCAVVCVVILVVGMALTRCVPQQINVDLKQTTIEAK